MDFRDVETRLRRLERLLAGLPAEANALWDDLQAVKRHLLHREAALSQLGDELGATQRRSMAAAAQLVAISRLQTTLDRGLMLQALEEIVASLVGCEELAVFELAGAPAQPSLVHAVGINADVIAALHLEDDMLARCVASGGMWVAEHRGAADRSSPRLTVCVPLEVDGRGVGALTLYRLLEHKSELEAADVELLNLLRLHLGVALVATRTRTLVQPS